jgi:CAAX prenyl protease-like protein
VPSAFLHLRNASTLGSALSVIPAPLRFGWIFIRVLTAITIVPISEELAFRGYLFRRIAGREFDRLPFNGLPLAALIISSLAFGLMHGSQWFVGALAGLAFGAILRKTGRIGDAIAAHAVSNLLLAAWVLTTGDWAQW